MRVQPPLRGRPQTGPIIEAACWAHARRKFVDLARINQAPIAAEAVARIDALCCHRGEINGLALQSGCLLIERSRPLIVDWRPGS